jgi:hypothetical protein
VLAVAVKPAATKMVPAAAEVGWWMLLAAVAVVQPTIMIMPLEALAPAVLLVARTTVPAAAVMAA